MAKAKRRAVFYNFILGFSLIVLIALSAIGCGTMTSLGLDQEVRCGQTEHIHSPDCYIGDVLICVQKAHTHDNGCYLLLLEDNDVNRLILSVSQAKKQTLEEVIDTIMEEAIRTSVTDPSIPAIRVTPTMKLTASDIKLLNGALNTTNSGVTLNENLGAGTALSYGVSTLAAIPSDVSSAIVTDATKDNNNCANFYVYFIDEEGTGGWAYLGTREFESVSSGWTTYYAVPTTDVIDIVNNALGTSYARNTLPDAYYSTHDNSDTWSGVNYEQSISRTYYTTFGTQSWFGGNDTSARYVYIGSGSAQNADPNTRFIRVSYEASSTPSVTASTSYYTVGTSITLPSLADGYLWEDQNGTRYEPGTKITPSYSLKLKAVSDTFTVIFMNGDEQVARIDNIIPGSVIASKDWPVDPSRDNYTFDGWYDDSGNVLLPTDEITRNLTLYAKWIGNPCTVTYQRTTSRGTTTVEEEVPYGTVITLDPDYTWTGYQSGESVTITKDTVFVGSIKTHTVRITQNGTTETFAVDHNDSFLLGTLPDGDWMWREAGGAAYNGGYRIPAVTSDLTFTAVQLCKVTFIDRYGNETTTLVEPGDAVTMPALSTNYAWVDEAGQSYAGGSSSGPIYSDTVFRAESTLGSITINYDVNFPSDSEIESEYAGSYTVSTAFYDSSGGNEISTGTPVLNTNLQATEQITLDTVGSPITVPGINYREVFTPVSGASAGEHLSIYFMGWEATVTDGSSTKTYLFEPGSTIPWSELIDLAGENGSINFNGKWEYTGATSVTFYLIYNARATAGGDSFASGYGNSYTDEVFCTHLFGLPTDCYENMYGVNGNSTNNNLNNSQLYGITGQTATSSVDAHNKIYQLYDGGVYYNGDARRINSDGSETILSHNPQYATTLYMLDFPSDAEIFAKLKAWVKSGELSGTLRADNGDGTQFDVPYTGSGTNRDFYDLDTDHYTIRWYVFKSEDDGWHVDGKLVKKVGTIKITKRFGGNEKYVLEAIAQANGETFITANSYGTDGGTDIERTVELLFTEGGTNGYTYDAATDTYSWTITDVEHGEKWIVTEFPPEPDNSLDMSEWGWVNTIAGTSDSDLGVTTREVTGITQAADELGKDWLLVDFTNIYHMENSILLRKVDGETMAGLSDALFNLYRTNSSGSRELMYFKFDAENGFYTWQQGYDPETNDPGVISDLPVNSSGFLEYTVSGFAFSDSDILVEEIVAHEGYAPGPTITVGYTGALDTEGNQIIGIKEIGIETTEEKPQDYYAYYDSGVLTVKNYPESAVNVAVKKAWDCSESYYEGLAVRLELTANGQVASSVIPGFADKYGSHFIYLDANGAFLERDTSGKPIYLDSSIPWAHQWIELPSVLSGKKVEWSVVETQVGDEKAGSEGNIPNWIVSVPKVETDSDGNLTLTVTNTPRRAMLRLTKLDINGTTALPGAKFMLTELDSNGNPTSVIRTGITSGDGVLTFDNLKYETWYTLVETTAPSGYHGFANAAYVKLSVNGVVTVTADLSDQTSGHSFVVYPNIPNNILVKNIPQTPLPETGGVGGDVYRLGGLLLILAAVAWFLYSRLPGTARFPAGAWKNESEDRNHKLRRSRFPWPPNPIPREPTPPHGKEEPNSS